MALTFRTGSDGKGSALTINELDNNFRYFTGSHEISGSLIISSSLTVSGSMGISGSIIPTEDSATLGSAIHPWKDIFVSDGSIIFVSGSSQVTSSFSVDSSGALSGSFDGDYTGSFTGSFDGNFTGSFTGSNLVNSGSVIFENLPTSEPSISGSLWVSGSSDSKPNSSYLLVFNP